jgi:hypothetical protein
LLPPFDQCFSAFLDDLAQRGLLETTLVLCIGQFTGNGVNETGRDHWSQCYSILLAGGPQPGGRIIGRSDRFAAYPAEDPITPPDLGASLLSALGVDPSTEVRDNFLRGVPVRVAACAANPAGIAVCDSETRRHHAARAQLLGQDVAGASGHDPLLGPGGGH